MGLRGIGAGSLTLKERRAALEEGRQRTLPWSKPFMKRWEKVVAFCEDLSITSGRDAHQRMKLRPWQKEFIQAARASYGPHLLDERVIGISHERNMLKREH
jgi:hypothetical protein